MTIKNSKIISATASELMQEYLRREWDDIYSFTDYIDALIALGVKIVDEPLTEKQKAGKVILDWCKRMHTYLDNLDKAEFECEDSYEEQIDDDYMAHMDIRQ